MQVKELAEEHKLGNGDLFTLMYNQVFEGWLYKVHSNSQKLNEFLLRLWLVEMNTGCIPCVVHVARTQMKVAGIYGLSWGDLLECMITGKNPLDFIPLNYSSDERSGGRVVSWINYWWKDRTGAVWGGRALKRLSPDDWFELHTQDRPRLWTPPQAAM